MKHLCLFLVFSLFSLTTIAQVKFITNSDTNGMELLQCQDNHSRILKAYTNQIDSQIVRLIVGIDYETSQGTSELILKRYYQALGQLIVKKIINTEMNKQLSQVNLEDFGGLKGKTHNVFKSQKIKVDISKQLREVLEKTSLSRNRLDEMAIREIIFQLIKKFSSELATNVYHSVVRGVAVQLTASTIENSVITFSTAVVSNAAKASFLSLLAFPLHGYRKPPSAEWLELLGKHPQIIINPEWMKLAGSQDHPWNTHCITIHREAKKMEKLVIRFLQEDDRQFQEDMRKISETPDFQIKEYSKNKILLFKEPIPEVMIDKTYTQKPRAQTLPPFWALP